MRGDGGDMQQFDVLGVGMRPSHARTGYGTGGRRSSACRVVLSQCELGIEAEFRDDGGADDGDSLPAIPPMVRRVKG